VTFTTEQIVTLLVPTLTALAAFLQGRRNQAKIAEIHVSVNSRLTELMASAQEAARLAGHAAGKAEEAAKHTTTVADAVKDAVKVVVQAVKENGNGK